MDATYLVSGWTSEEPARQVVELVSAERLEGETYKSLYISIHDVYLAYRG